MDNNYTLSVTITVYNQKEYVKKAVESIMSQNIDFSYEILIGDDGSNDGSYEYIQELYGNYEHIKIYKMPRDTSIKEFSNWRHSRLIRFLLNEAKGKYVAILDGDDFYCSQDCFKRKIEILEKKENQDCVACAGAMKIISVEGVEYDRGPYIKPQKITMKQKMYKYKKLYFPIANCVIRRGVFANINRLFDEEFADQGILYFILHYGKIYFSPGCDFAYRQCPNSIWQKGNDAEHAIRGIIGFDIMNQAFGDYYFKRLMKERKNYIYIDKYKTLIPQLVDWDMWYGYANKYNLQIILALMDSQKVSPVVKNKTKKELLFLKILNIFMWPQDFYQKKLNYLFMYIKESFLFLIKPSIPLTKKVERIQTTMKSIRKSKRNKA